MSPISLLLADDHSLFRDGLRQILEGVPDFVVVGEARNADTTVEVATKTHPDVVLLDVEMPGDPVSATVSRILQRLPGTAIVVLSMDDWPQVVADLLDRGARGYLLKSVTRHELIAAVRTVYENPDRTVLSISRESLAQLHGQRNDLLSDRELDVLRLVAEAKSNAQIARELFITEGTVKLHVRHIFAKLGAVSRIDAVNKAVAAAILNPFPAGRKATGAKPRRRPDAS
jgi:DNA-binding NarL/FixJ family response regulator